MPKREVPEELGRLTLDVLRPIRDFVITHGTEDLPGHPLRYVRMRLADSEDPLVICAVTERRYTRLRISMGDVVPPEHLIVLTFDEDGGDSWVKFDDRVEIGDILTLSKTVEAATKMVCPRDTSELN